MHRPELGSARNLQKRGMRPIPPREVENGEETEFILCPSCVTGGACNLCLGGV